MKIHRNPSFDELQTILQRPSAEETLTYKVLVNEVFKNIKLRGDIAVLEYARKWDNYQNGDFQLSIKDINKAEKNLSSSLKKAIDTAFKNIYTFHKKQASKDFHIETYKGIVCGRKTMPISRIGLYIPGGDTPLFSTVLMLGIPAMLAKCKELILCSPPNSKGELHPAILYAAKLCKIKTIFKLGGAQAIGAMHYGTESIPKVFKIFGPGNAIVTEAKRLAQYENTAIDMLAGPTEVMLVADKKSHPYFVASDILAQLEHGKDSQAICITDSETIAVKILEEIENILPKLSRQDILQTSKNNFHCIVLKSLKKAVSIINEYAPEHLILHSKKSELFLKENLNAGSIFLGSYTPEAMGDYASGTNHVLPTLGLAKYHAGVSLDSFVRKVTWQKASQKGLKNLSQVIIRLAKEEGLDAHAFSIQSRLKNNI